jgi:hypothetical protein
MEINEIVFVLINFLLVILQIAIYFYYEMNFLEKNKIIIKNSVLNKNHKRIERENLKIFLAKYCKH